jgi:hypothetical protein
MRLTWSHEAMAGEVIPRAFLSADRSFLDIAASRGLLRLKHLGFVATVTDVVQNLRLHD